MSSTNEILLEQIKDMEINIEEARKMGDERAFFTLSEKLKDLKIRFHVSSAALNESKLILKG